MGCRFGMLDWGHFNSRASPLRPRLSTNPFQEKGSPRDCCTTSATNIWITTPGAVSRAAAVRSPRPRFRSVSVPASLLGPTFETQSDFFDHGIGDCEAQKSAAQIGGVASAPCARGFCHHKPHASNAANAACGSCFNLNIVCLDKPSALAMADRLGGLALSRASLMRSNIARS
jgi:hypothetical protein